MSEEKTTAAKRTRGWVKRLKRVISLALNGKFFPRKLFARNWGILLTLVVLFLAAIAHRNMYMVQLNKIKLLEVRLTDRRTDRVLLEYKRDENLRLHEISEAVDRHNLPLIHSPEPKEEILLPCNVVRNCQDE